MFRGVIRLADTQPLLMGAWVMGTIAVSLSSIVVPMRDALGLPTNQNTKKLNSDLTPAQIYLAKKAASQESS